MYSKASRPAPGPTQLPIQWTRRALSLEVMRPGREAGHLPHLVPRLRMSGSVPLLPHKLPWRAQEQRYLTLPTDRLV